MTLYELTNELQQLLALAEDPEVDPQVLQDTIDAVTGEIEEKADGYAKVIRQMESDLAGLKNEIDRLTMRKKSIDNSIDRMKDALQMAMIIANKPKFKTELFSFNIQKNPPKVVVDDPGNIPRDFLIEQEPKIDTMGLKKILQSENGAFLNGIAHLEQSESLRIK